MKRDTTAGRAGEGRSASTIWEPTTSAPRTTRAPISSKTIEVMRPPAVRRGAIYMYVHGIREPPMWRSAAGEALARSGPLPALELSVRRLPRHLTATFVGH
jgi:hypothetical protein